MVQMAMIILFLLFKILFEYVHDKISYIIYHNLFSRNISVIAMLLEDFEYNDDVSIINKF